jgi:hypothetical protein
MTQEYDEMTEAPEVADVPEPDQEPGEQEEADDGDDGAGEAAEPEDGDRGEQGEGEPEPLLQAAGAADDAGIEKAFNALKNEATRHANRISAIMGDDAQVLLPCPRCVTTDPQRPATPGFIWPNEIVPLLPADKAAVKLSIGEGAEPDYLKAQDAARCGQCDGLGLVDTGSQVANQRHLKCLNCQGRGWTGSRTEASLPVPQNGPTDLVTVGGPPTEPTVTADPWGRLPGDPLFGVLPGYER